MLLALAGVDGNGLVGQAGLLKEQRDFCGVGSRVEIEPKSWYLLGVRLLPYRRSAARFLGLALMDAWQDHISRNDRSALRMASGSRRSR